MLSAENVSQGSVRCVSFPQRNPLCPSRRVTRFSHAHRYALRVHCLFSAVVPPRGFWRGTQHPGVWAPRSPKPATRSCSSLCSPRAPCWCVWQKRPPGLSCEVQIPRSPGTSEPGAPSRRGQPPQTCPGLVGEGGTCSVRGPRTVCPVTSSPASLWMWSIVWTTRFMKEASDHVVFFFADFSKGLSNLVYLVQRLNEAI